VGVEGDRVVEGEDDVDDGVDDLVVDVGVAVEVVPPPQAARANDSAHAQSKIEAPREIRWRECMKMFLPYIFGNAEATCSIASNISGDYSIHGK